MKSFTVFMLRIALLALLLVSPAMAQSLSWKAPETVPAGKTYTVSVSCIEAASLVLLKEGVVVAVGTVAASVTSSDSVAQTITYTAHAYPGNVSAGAMTSTCTVTITMDDPAAVSAAPDIEGSVVRTPAPAADPAQPGGTKLSPRP